MFSINQKIDFLRFGYLPTGRFLVDLYGKSFGHENIFKRLQAPDLIKALNLSSDEQVLDFGCGVGYVTVELAKIARKAVGIDINPCIESITIPKVLCGKLEYCVARGESMQFEDNTFDKVLMSEVIATIDEPEKFLKEVRRVMKPDGLIVICNGAGPLTLKKLFDSKGAEYCALKKKYPTRMPDCYESYTSLLSHGFGNKLRGFYQLEDLRRLAEAAGFREVSYSYSPGKKASRIIAKRQLEDYLACRVRNRKLEFLLRFRRLKNLSDADKEKNPGGLIYVAQNHK